MMIPFVTLSWYGRGLGNKIYISIQDDWLLPPLVVDYCFAAFLTNIYPRETQTHSFRSLIPLHQLHHHLLHTFESLPFRVERGLCNLKIAFAKCELCTIAVSVDRYSSITGYVSINIFIISFKVAKDRYLPLATH